jgi:hypothetical protein
LRATGVVELQQHVKVSRSEVRSIIFHSLVRIPFASAWRRLYVPSLKAVDSGGKLA